MHVVTKFTVKKTKIKHADKVDINIIPVFLKEFKITVNKIFINKKIQFLFIK
jgi:hypothetical protein